MARQKLKRFQENLGRPNIFESNKGIYTKLKGNWSSKVFKNEYPIVAEFGCGRGEYSVGLARINTDQNFVGIDVKGDRLWVGSTEAIEEGLTNVAFLRAQIENIEEFFDDDELNAIWITFPDPRPKDRDIKRRLTSPRFLEYYKNLLQPGGTVYFKTDNTALFQYTLEVLSERKDITKLEYTFDLYHSEYMDEHHGIKTKFEKKFHDLGEDIKYMKFQFIK